MTTPTDTPTGQSSDDMDIPTVPLEELLRGACGEPYIAIHGKDGLWEWEFRDEFNHPLCKSSVTFASLKIALDSIHRAQVRMGNIAATILRVI